MVGYRSLQVEWLRPFLMVIRPKSGPEAIRASDFRDGRDASLAAVTIVHGIARCMTIAPGLCRLRYNDNAGHRGECQQRGEDQGLHG